MTPDVVAGFAAAAGAIDLTAYTAVLTDASGALHLLRNEGGNRNMAVHVELKGLRTGSGKNNDFGIGAGTTLGVNSIRIIGAAQSAGSSVMVEDCMMDGNSGRGISDERTGGGEC